MLEELEEEISNALAQADVNLELSALARGAEDEMPQDGETRQAEIETVLVKRAGSAGRSLKFASSVPG